LLTLRKENTHKVSEKSAEENIWSEEGWNDKRLEKTA
jgi:hypothetical protein